MTRLEEAKAKIAEERARAARKDHALAQELALATSAPFPELTFSGQGCNCAFGPRCQSNRNCVDESADMGIKCRRSGEIRKLAEWSVILPWTRRPRVLFYCNDCLDDLKAVWDKPLVAITRPAHASEFWQPSIGDHVRQAMMRNRARA